MDLDFIISRYNAKIGLLARRMIQNAEIAEEALQETWYQIIKSIDSFKAESDIGTWIYTIAKRTILNYSKRERTYSNKIIERHLSEPEIEYEGDGKDKDMWVKEKCYDCLTAFCHCLQKEDRLIFIFREMIGLSYAEICDIMAMEERALRKRLSRAKGKMKKYLSGHCVLYNPNGDCTCRIKKHVQSVGLDKAYKIIEKTAGLLRFFEISESTYPKKEYWEKVVFSSHKTE